MANEVKHAEEKKTPTRISPRDELFWQKNGKLLIYGISAILVVVAGYFIYQNYVLAPKEEKAANALWKAEYNFRQDSARLALNGEGGSAGFLRIMSRYDGTKAATLAKFYAAACYMKLDDFANAIKYLRDFKSDDELINVRAAGLLGDAYAETGKKNEAVDQYRKAGTMFPDDKYNSSEYLFRAGMLYQDLGKNKEAIEMFSIVKEKYPNTERGVEIDKYLARLGSF